MHKRVLSVLVLLFQLFGMFTVAVPVGATTNPSLHIVEIKLGGDSYTEGIKDPQEFVKIMNIGTSVLDLTTVYIEYAKKAFNPSECAQPEWTGTNAKRVSLTGTIEPGAASVVTGVSLTDNTAGSLRIIELQPETSIVHDLVGWGSDSPCSETSPAAQVLNSKSLKRFVDCSGEVVDTNNNGQDLIANQTPSPHIFNNPTHEPCDPDEIDCEVAQECIGPTPDPLQLEITELLPNATSYDTGREFIELHNPNLTEVALAGYSLRLAGSSKVHDLPTDTVLGKGEYIAFSDSVTGLVLPNTTASIELLAPDDSVVDTTQVYTSPPDGESWAFIDATWQYTNQPTPGAQNRQSVVETQNHTDTSANALTDCPTGQYRNPETNRCRLLQAAVAELVPCKPGQERNPETNRCRTVAVGVLTSLTPCKPGQERNPETNRCRALGASTTLAACAVGQERNPETNRCRKVSAAASSLPDVKDVASQASGAHVRWWFIGGVVMFAGGYALYEWRQDVTNFFLKRRMRIASK